MLMYLYISTYGGEFPVEKKSLNIIIDKIFSLLDFSDILKIYDELRSDYGYFWNEDIIVSKDKIPSETVAHSKTIINSDLACVCKQMPSQIIKPIRESLTI